MKWDRLNAAPLPTTCALCQAGRYHAPCLVDLSAGTVTELAIYAPDPHWEAELAPVQDFGVFRVSHNRSGIVCHADPYGGWCKANVSSHREAADFSLLCSACRGALLRMPLHGYLLADLYGETPVFYPLRAAPVRFRGYTVTVSGSGRIFTIQATAGFPPA